MKSLFGFLILAAIGASAFAESEVKITTFQFAGSRTRAAELCARVSGVTEFPVFVKIVVDEKSKKPGIYNEVVGSEAEFCTTVVTYEGTAIASVWGQQSVSSAEIAKK